METIAQSAFALGCLVLRARNIKRVSLRYTYRNVCRVKCQTAIYIIGDCTCAVCINIHVCEYSRGKTSSIIHVSVVLNEGTKGSNKALRTLYNERI